MFRTSTVCSCFVCPCIGLYANATLCVSGKYGDFVIANVVVLSACQPSCLLFGPRVRSVFRGAIRHIVYFSFTGFIVGCML